MSLFSSLIKVIFIISLAFFLYSETAFLPSMDISEKPDCSMYEDRYHPCTREHNPVCATNGETYSNPCVFCTEMIGSQRTFGFSHFGYC